MWLKTYKPYTPSRRFMTGYDFSNITAKKPHKRLVRSKKQKSWKNQYWRTTIRFRWWWHKKLYRIIDFRWYDKLDIPGKVASIEYDPNRKARIALVVYADWEKRYNIAWKWANVWDRVLVSNNEEYEKWFRKQLKDIPDWFNVFNVEVTPFTNWKLVRSAWNYATLMGRDEQQKIVFIKIASWEVRKFDEKCWATIWVVSNEEHKNMVLWKAWRSRWLWRRPRVRWKAMNPVDHAHGGWEGRTWISLVYPKSFSGKPVPPGKKTRKKKKWSDKFIVSRRTKN